MSPGFPTVGPYANAFSKLVSAAKLLFTPVAIAFLVYLAWQSRAQLEEVLANAEPLYLLVSLAFWLLMHLAAPVTAITIFRGLGHDVAYRDATRIHIANLPARYLPGGIWHTVGRVVNYREVGIGKRDLALFVLMEHALSATTAFILGGTLLAAFRDLQGWGVLAALFVGASLLALLLLPRFFRARSGNGGVAFRPRCYLASLLAATLAWCIAASSFVAFVIAFPGVTRNAAYLEIAGTYLFSWGIGFIAIFAPQGVGVFEVTAAALLRDSTLVTGIVPLLAMFRLVILAADLVAWLGLRALIMVRAAA